MGKQLRAAFLILTAIASAVSGQETNQPTPAPDPVFKLIQEVAVPKDDMVVGSMKVSGDGSMVLYIVQTGGESVEYAVMVNKTRLPNKLLEMATDLRTKTGNTSIPLDAAAYRFTMVDEITPNPLWQAVTYGVMIQGFGPFVLANLLKPPDYAPAYCVSGTFPSWFLSPTTGDSIALWAVKDGKIKLFAGEETDIEEGAQPVRPAVIRDKNKAYVLQKAGRQSLYMDGKKVSEDHDSIEVPALFHMNASADNTVAYIAKDGEKRTLFLDGKFQETQFPPAHDLFYATGAKPWMYAATDKGREFVVRDGARVTKDKDFTQVRMPTFGKDKTQLAYVAKDKREWVMVNDKKVTPEYNTVTFCQEQFRITGDLTFAGYDTVKSTIVVGTLKPPAETSDQK